MSIIYLEHLGNSLLEIKKPIEDLISLIFVFVIDVFKEVILYRLKLFQGLAFEVSSYEQYLSFFVLEVLVIDIEVGTELSEKS